MNHPTTCTGRETGRRDLIALLTFATLVFASVWVAVDRSCKCPDSEDSASCLFSFDFQAANFSDLGDAGFDFLPATSLAFVVLTPSVDESLSTGVEVQLVLRSEEALYRLAPKQSPPKIRA